MSGRTTHCQSADDVRRYVGVGPWNAFVPVSVPNRNARRWRLASREPSTRDAYRIEKVLFESRPSFPVTANLYLPTGVPFPRPAVVGSCGHSANGKAYSAYQSFAQGLARLGYVCLLYDPLGQGERLQYTKPDLTSRVGCGCGGTPGGRQPAVSGRRIPGYVAGLGWYPRARLLCSAAPKWTRVMSASPATRVEAP